ncbi:hypothetical protein PCO31010_01636 [Pandoraea commovens]|uniref:Uncharacterized protein n=1 Tax=Pandoraea commovens TaxID=2508289 RepID=A0A5E4TSU2_9BURK|nr:hypothetical protein PCO31010_01636 [Pandoraea commovens]
MGAVIAANLRSRHKEKNAVLDKDALLKMK